LKQAVLKFTHVSFRYFHDWVIEDISLEVAEGEFVGIIGPNGSGKTTLLKLADGILKSEKGSIELCGRPLEEFSRKSIAKLVAVVPQESLLVFPFRVREVVLMGRTPHLPRFSFEGKRDLEIAERAMDMTGIRDLAGRHVESLSGGERQRVLIARALAQQPRIMLLDEPTAFLDIRHQIDIFDLIRFLCETEGLTIAAVTHDINLASIYSDRIVLLDAGKIYREGLPEEVITSTNIGNVYKTKVLVDSYPDTGLPRITPVRSNSPQGC